MCAEAIDIKMDKQDPHKQAMKTFQRALLLQSTIKYYIKVGVLYIRETLHHLYVPPPQSSKAKRFFFGVSNSPLQHTVRCYNTSLQRGEINSRHVWKNSVACSPCAQFLQLLFKSNFKKNNRWR